VDNSRAENWFQEKGWKAFPFQKETWKGHAAGLNGMVNAPTGSGKTYSLLLPIILESAQKPTGLCAIWVTPIRALAKEILQSGQRAIDGLDVKVSIEIRTGDTSARDKARIKRSPPNILITTPESLHVMLCQKHYDKYFQNLQTVVVDEWHDLLGSKRGVQLELALSKFKALNPSLKIWAISATIGNMQESLEVLLGNWFENKPHTLIRSKIKKKYIVESVFPDDLEELPWAGHLGLNLFDKVIPILLKSESTLIFLNTRGQAEIWYQRLLEHSPDFAGVVALHHGSMSRETRHWVEDALHEGKLKCVICTSSLDLGVDFRPVETIIQVGSPKGVSRFMQRAGRSGHQPGATSKIYFLPTHSLELIEAAALREATEKEMVESRVPYLRSFDVLLQYMVSLAVSNGFNEAELFNEIRTCFCYQSLSREEWEWCLDFIVTGGDSLGGYDEFHKVVVEDGLYTVTSKKVAMRHRLSIGTIVSDTMIKVKYVRGGFIGNVAESFMTRMHPGDTFWFAGRSLEFVRIKGITAEVRKSNKERGPVPSWNGGRMPLSSQMSQMLRKKLNEAESGVSDDPEIHFMKPLIDRQKMESILPTDTQFLIEQFESSDGYHATFFPFEGRFVHEGMAALIAYRISLLQPITFSNAMNDYGFELLSDQPIPVQDAIDTNIFSTDHLMDDIYASINSVEMGRRKFRDIAQIAGLIFNGYPGKNKKQSHIQASSQLFFDVFNDYDPSNLLFRQSFDEVTDFQLEEHRLRTALARINDQEIVVTKPVKYTPLSFPIIVDRARETLTSEKFSDRIKKMSVI
jgi:ATP-dependent helicase Lhr and Lhr-like helicase